jgi:hypothetical protein
MTQIRPLTQFRVPLGGQEIALQELQFEAGGMCFLRTRIREKSRFTIFDVDPVTARLWGEHLLRWAAAQPASTEPVAIPETDPGQVDA